MKRLSALFVLLCLLAPAALALPGEGFGIDLRARELDSEQSETVSRLDAAKARQRVRTPGDAMSVLYKRLNRDVYRNLIDGAWGREGYRAYEMRSGEYAYPGGNRYVDPTSINQMVAWLLSDDMDIGVIAGFPAQDPVTSVCCIRMEKGIVAFNAAGMIGVDAPGTQPLPTGDFESFQQYVERFRSRDNVRTLYYLPGGIGIRWKDRDSYVESLDPAPELIWAAEPEENHEYDWMN